MIRYTARGLRIARPGLLRPATLGAAAVLMLQSCAPEVEPQHSPAVASPSPNAVAGTWRMVSATVENEAGRRLPYGERPNGMLVFTPDLHFVEVLTDGDAPRFASSTRGEGTDVENRRAMATSIGFFGTYTVAADGRFTGNRVEGSTFPNWIGAVRTTRELRLRVEGDRMFEEFTRPDGNRVTAEFVRVGAAPQSDGG